MDVQKLQALVAKKGEPDLVKFYKNRLAKAKVPKKEQTKLLANIQKAVEKVAKKKPKKP